jgi:hypothetical protein
MKFFRSLLEIAPEQTKEFDEGGNLPIHLAARMERYIHASGIKEAYLEILDALF